MPPSSEFNATTASCSLALLRQNTVHVLQSADFLASSPLMSQLVCANCISHVLRLVSVSTISSFPSVHYLANRALTPHLGQALWILDAVRFVCVRLRLPLRTATTSQCPSLESRCGNRKNKLVVVFSS